MWKLAIWNVRDINSKKLKQWWTIAIYSEQYLKLPTVKENDDLVGKLLIFKKFVLEVAAKTLKLSKVKTEKKTS